VVEYQSVKLPLDLSSLLNKNGIPENKVLSNI
jgi:hypothetical protein